MTKKDVLANLVAFVAIILMFIGLEFFVFQEQTLELPASIVIGLCVISYIAGKIKVMLKKSD